MSSAPLHDLIATRDRLRSGATSVANELEICIEAGRSARCDAAWTLTTFDQARSEAAQPMLANQPLAGLAISVKDLFDVQGQVTRAGSTVLDDQPPALRDCPAVARLRSAGGVSLGRTHMVEFAYSGVGVNPHLGTPSNAASRTRPLIPGGSSSGAAVTVATGASFVGLGSDTGGSIRIPAALNGIVGFKSTARLVPTTGAIPLSTTLDTVGALTRSVRDAILVHEILGRQPVVRSMAPLAAYRLAVPSEYFLDDLDPTVARAFERTLHQLSRGGARIETVALPELAQVAALNGHGGFSAAESLAWHRPWIESRRARYDPRVLARIERGHNLSAADYVDLVRMRERWIHAMEARLTPFDAVLAPTVPIPACPIADVAPGAERDDAFFRVNGLLLRNTSAVNLLDGCAISIPCHAPDELPVGLMIWHGALRDDTVLAVAALAEAVLAPWSRSASPSA